MNFEKIIRLLENYRVVYLPSLDKSDQCDLNFDHARSIIKSSNIEDLIKDKLISQIDEWDETKKQLNSWISFEKGNLVERNNELFALYHGAAYKLFTGEIPTEKGRLDKLYFFPVVFGNECIGQFPDEGSSGILHLQFSRIRKNHKWNIFTSAIHAGWLNESELKLSNYEISTNIIDEINAGENVLYPKPVGWV